MAERQATAFSLPQDYENLGFAISCHLHQNLLMLPAEKILFPNSLTFGGDCRHIPLLGSGTNGTALGSLRQTC